MKNRYKYSIVSNLIFNFFFSGDVMAHEMNYGALQSDTSKPSIPKKKLWKEYLSDTLWDEQNRMNQEHDYDEHDGCHKTSIWKLSYNVILNKPLNDSRLSNDTLYNRDTLLRRINGLSGQQYAWQRFKFWHGDTGRKFNPLNRRVTPHSHFYFMSAHPLNANHWLLQSQNFLGFRAQYGITNYLSAGVSRDYSGFWMLSNLSLCPIQYRGYAAAISVHGGKYFPLNSKIWGASINQTFVSKYTKTSLRISSNELYDIKDSRKQNLTFNFSHIQRINATWSILAEVSYLPGKERKPMIAKYEWWNAEQLKSPRALDQYTYLIGLRKAMGRKTQFDFGIQTVSTLGEIYTEKKVPMRSFVEKWTVVLPFPFINMSIAL
jgi:hypothetical protein